MSIFFNMLVSFLFNKCFPREGQSFPGEGKCTFLKEVRMRKLFFTACRTHGGNHYVSLDLRHRRTSGAIADDFVKTLQHGTVSVGVAKLLDQLY